jgi:hypothetical protein
MAQHACNSSRAALWYLDLCTPCTRLDMPAVAVKAVYVPAQQHADPRWHTTVAFTPQSGLESECLDVCLHAAFIQVNSCCIKPAWAVLWRLAALPCGSKVWHRCGDVSCLCYLGRALCDSRHWYRATPAWCCVVHVLGAWAPCTTSVPSARTRWFCGTCTVSTRLLAVGVLCVPFYHIYDSVCDFQASHLFPTCFLMLHTFWEAWGWGCDACKAMRLTCIVSLFFHMRPPRAPCRRASVCSQLLDCLHRMAPASSLASCLTVRWARHFASGSCTYHAHVLIDARPAFCKSPCC